MYKVLYTHQKLKKRKTWQDGSLEILSGTKKGILRAEDNSVLDSLFVKSSQLECGLELESEKYLINIESRISHERHTGEAHTLQVEVRSAIGSCSLEEDKLAVPPIFPLKEKPFQPVVRKGQTVAKYDPPLTQDGGSPRVAWMEKVPLAEQETRSLFTSIASGINGTISLGATHNRRAEDISQNSGDSKLQFGNARSLYDNISAETEAPRMKKRSSIEILGLFAPMSENTHSKIRDVGEEPSAACFYAEVAYQESVGAKPFGDAQWFEGDSCLDQQVSEEKRECYNSCGAGREPCYPLPNKKRKADVVEESSRSGLSSRNVESVGNERPGVPEESEPAVLQNSSSILSSSTYGPLLDHHLASRRSFQPPVKYGPSPVQFDCRFRKAAGLASLTFPEGSDVLSCSARSREIEIPVTFSSITVYKETLVGAVVEHLNIVLCNFAKSFHTTLCKANFLFDDGSTPGVHVEVDAPSCKHGAASLKAVRKEGKNKGRLFYSCPGTGNARCNFFKWQDENHVDRSPETSSAATALVKKPIVSGGKAIHSFFSAHGINFYVHAKLESKSRFQTTRYGSAKWKKDSDVSKSHLYLVLPCKGPSSQYNKLDLWVISKFPHFPKTATFIAKSEFYGPNSSLELEIEPISSYSMSNWSKCESVYALLVGNARTEITAIDNIDRYFSVNDVPVAPHILSVKQPCSQLPPLGRRSIPHPINIRRGCRTPDKGLIMRLLENTVCSFHLNPHQAQALEHVASMFLAPSDADRCPVTLIHGVFGAGKSYLLATAVLFLVQLFDRLYSDTGTSHDSSGDGSRPKILIASTTNVAVDRVLQALLDLGFDDFIRVGSVKKIACPILPFSVHASDKQDEELRELNEMLATDLSSTERGFVRRALEIHKLGANRRKLADVGVVGVTCAACIFPCMEDLQFQVQLLDECSQMTEPMSLLPIARFRCEKLVLVGDPKQLSPTIQGSEASHGRGLEFTLFERLQEAGCVPAMLLTQYRCHPSISVISSSLFYSNQLIDGISSGERSQLFSWFPTTSLLDCSDGVEEMDPQGSYFNVKEAAFVSLLVSCLLSLGVGPSQIGVITQYRAQASKILAMLQECASTHSSSEMRSVRISTVDAFQGAERDVIILSCVRTRNSGFIDCPRRTNVALTRARRHLAVVGSMKLLGGNKLWKEVIRIARDNGAAVESVCSFSERLRLLSSDKD